LNLVGDGSQAELHLGGSFINLESIDEQFRDSLELIGESLSDDADVLIYGCNFGEGVLGREAMLAIAETGSLKKLLVPLSQISL